VDSEWSLARNLEKSRFCAGTIWNPWAGPIEWFGRVDFVDPHQISRTSTLIVIKCAVEIIGARSFLDPNLIILYPHPANNF
jgi:hypothetical protein